MSDTYNYNKNYKTLHKKERFLESNMLDKNIV